MQKKIKRKYGLKFVKLLIGDAVECTCVITNYVVT